MMLDLPVDVSLKIRPRKLNILQAEKLQEQRCFLASIAKNCVDFHTLSAQSYRTLLRVQGQSKFKSRLFAIEPLAVRRLTATGFMTYLAAHAPRLILYIETLICLFEGAFR